MPILSEEDLERFRTKVCTLASSMKCDFGVERCNYSHNIYWARRCPFYLRDSSILRYVPACCPDVELGEGTTVLRNSCPRGNNCSFAHSLEEIHYHPLVYKTEVCKDYRLGKCKTYYCHLVHGLAEIRIPKQYVIPKKGNLNIPSYPNVTMVDNIRSFHGENNGSHHRDKHKNEPKRDPLAGLTDMRISWLSGNHGMDNYGVDTFYLSEKSQFADGLTNDASRLINGGVRSLSLPDYKHIEYTDDWPRMGRLHENGLGDLNKPIMNTSIESTGMLLESMSHESAVTQVNEMDTMMIRKFNSWNVDENSMISAETNCGNENDTTATLQFNEGYESEMMQRFKTDQGLNGMYDAVSNQCEIIKEMCKGPGNKTWTSVVRETELLWRLVMEVNTFLYGKCNENAVETSLKEKSGEPIHAENNGLEISWNSWSALYSELLENIEDEKVITNSKVLLESQTARENSEDPSK